MNNPYIEKIVRLVERAGDSARFQRVERETEELLAHAKVQVDKVIADALVKSDQLITSAHAARVAFEKKDTSWEPGIGNEVVVDGNGNVESVVLTNVTVVLSRSNKRASRIVISTEDGRSLEITHSGSATVSSEGGKGHLVPISKRSVS